MTITEFAASAVNYSPAAKIPSMLSVDERALYYAVARDEFRGRGAVVEIGTWLGSGTYEICRGLTETGRDWSLTVMDRFVWTEFYEAHNRQPGLAAGDSFLQAFLANVAPYADRITPVVGDLADIRDLMPLPRLIELLFVDAPKSWRMLWHVLDYLGPRLLPGGRLVFQDFFHVVSRQLIWLLMSLPQLRVATVVANGTAAVFEVRAPIDDIGAAVPRDFRQVGAADLVALWERLRAEWPPARSAHIAVGIALDLLDRKAVAPACEILEAGVVRSEHRAAVVKEIDRLLRKADKEAAKLAQIRDFVTGS